jgi:hypothetical protein
MTEGVFEISNYRKPTWEETQREYEKKIKTLAAQSVLETNRGGQHDNENN